MVVTALEGSRMEGPREAESPFFLQGSEVEEELVDCVSKQGCIVIIEDLFWYRGKALWLVTIADLL